MQRINDISSLKKVLPDIGRTYDYVNNKWNLGRSKESFIDDLFETIGSDRTVFISQDVNDKIKLLAVVFQLSNSDYGIELLFIDPAYKLQTANLISELENELKDMNASRYFFETRRISRSYDRWMKRLGMKKYKLIYGKEV